MKYFYGRVSTKDQNLARQIKVARDLGFTEEQMFLDKMSGAKEKRPALTELLDKLQEGDEITVMSMDRLSRSTKHLLNLMDLFAEKGVAVHFLKENLDTGGAYGKLIMTVFAAINEFQREIILEAQREGLAVAKAEGRIKGRPKANASKIEYALMLLENNKELTAQEIADKAGISRKTLYNYAKKAGITRA